MALFISREREDIVRLWDDLYIGAEEDHGATCSLPMGLQMKYY